MASTDAPSLPGLAFLYLTFGHSTDDAITGEEMRTLAKRLHQWAPDTSLPDLGAVLKSTVLEYKKLPGRNERFARTKQYVSTLTDQSGGVELEKVMTDLHAIASADGEVSEVEKTFMRDVAELLGVPSPV